MALPVVSVPTYELTIPSTKQKVKFRPFLVKEEKALLIAQQSEDTKTMYETLKSIIASCLFNKIEVDSLAMFDIEYIFCQLRAKSVGEDTELVFNCLECNDPKGKIKINIDLTELEVKFTEGHKANIDLYGDIGIKMKYPGIEMLNKLKNFEDTEVVFDIIVDCIDCIYTTDEVFPAKEQSKDELLSFVENLTQEQFAKIQNFFETMPKLEKRLEFTCPSCGFQHKQVLQGLDSFF